MELSAIESPTVVSVDWFALSCCLGKPYTGQTIVVPSGYSVLPCSGTAVWEYRFFIMDDVGNKVATILTKPKSPIIDARRAVVEIANPILYDYNFRKVTDMVCESLPMSIEGVNRVDLCGDFNMTDRHWQVVRGLEQGDMYLKGLRKGVVWFSADNGIRVPHQLNWGGKDSVFHWKLYYKYKELHEGGVSPSKPYIENMWRDLGLDVKHVWRLEVSITSSNSVEKADGGGRVEPFEWYDNRAELYKRIYSDKFIIRLDEGHKNKRLDGIVRFLSMDGDGGKFLKHKSDKDSIRESDCERRVVCKMWKEYQDGEVRANDFLHAAIGEFLRTMCQFERNVMAICRRFNLTETEVYKELEYMDDKRMPSTLNINQIIEQARAEDWDDEIIFPVSIDDENQCYEWPV